MIIIEIIIKRNLVNNDNFRFEPDVHWRYENHIKTLEIRLKVGKTSGITSKVELPLSIFGTRLEI